MYGIGYSDNLVKKQKQKMVLDRVVKSTMLTHGKIFP
jgi:hypothetical protein